MHSLALSNKGHIYSWGNGREGRLGTGDTNSQTSPKIIESIVNTVIKFLTTGNNRSEVWSVSFSLQRQKQFYLFLGIWEVWKAGIRSCRRFLPASKNFFF